MDPQLNLDTIMSIGVLEFEYKPLEERQVHESLSSWYISDAGAVVSDMVASELMGLSMYTVRERSDLARVLEEHKLQLSDIVAKGDYRLLGKIAGVNAVVVGRVSAAHIVHGWGNTHVEASYTCRCVNTTTGDVLWSMGGEKSVDYTPKAGPYWFRVLTKELVQELRRTLEALLDSSPPSKDAEK